MATATAPKSSESLTVELPVDTKKCRDCGETKPLSEFYPRKSARDGYHGSCRQCHCDKARQWRLANSERHRKNCRGWARENKEHKAQLNREWDEKNPHLKAKYRKQHDERNPLKAKARHAVNHAIRDGLLHKPERCEDCKQIVPSRLLHGHHEDYSEPLKVDWLCRACHFARHAEQGSA